VNPALFQKNSSKFLAVAVLTIEKHGKQRKVQNSYTSISEKSFGFLCALAAPYF
jgi:hypothetical protein